jgi:hypothetical protein
MRKLPSLRAAVERFDRSAFPAFRWMRLWLWLQRGQVDAAAAPAAVRAELRHQTKLWGDSAALPAWARELVSGAAAPSKGPASDVPPPRSKRRVDDAGALTALVHHLDAHRGVPISLVARAWAASQPQLGKRWADPAIKRLAAAGVLVKRRPPGRANVPTWHLVPLEEALKRL